jgi:cellulose synthase/poly-beta-1,6-N-acetylglucosamine synthase-like glycosyltransferase
MAKNDDCDGYIVFDADNLVDKNYISEMNKTFNLGFDAVTSYRNSKNYGTNWISAGYSLWFLRESKYLNNARMRLNTSCAISGTASA